MDLANDARCLDGSLVLPPTAKQLYDPGFVNAGARAHTNSWGSGFSNVGGQANGYYSAANAGDLIYTPLYPLSLSLDITLYIPFI